MKTLDNNLKLIEAVDYLDEFVGLYDHNIMFTLSKNDRLLNNSDQAFTFTGSLVVGEDATVRNDLTVSETITAQQLQVSGQATLSGVFVEGQSQFTGNTTFLGNVVFQGECVGQRVDVEDILYTDRIGSQSQDGVIDLRGNRFINAVQSPRNSADLCNKAYVDQKATGLQPFEPVIASDLGISLSDQGTIFSYDSSGNYTGTIFGAETGALVVDCRPLKANDRLLVTSFRGESASANGIYRVADPGSTETTWEIVRADDLNSAEAVNTANLVYIQHGESNGGGLAYLNRSTPFTPKEFNRRPIVFSPYRAYVDVLVSEPQWREELSDVRGELDSRAQHLTNAIQKVAQQKLPATVEVPVGTIIHSLSPNPPDETWIGIGDTNLRIQHYPELYDAIGASDNGDGTFDIPDIQGRALYTPGNGFTASDLGGSQTHQLTVNQMPSHSHTLNLSGHTHDLDIWSWSNSGQAPDDSGVITGGDPALGSQYQKTTLTALSGQAGATLGDVGSGAPFSLMPPYYVAYCYIKARSSVPSQSLPDINWFSFYSQVVDVERSGYVPEAPLYIRVAQEGLTDTSQLEFIDADTGEVRRTFTDLTAFAEKTLVTMTNLNYGENRIYARITNPTVTSRRKTEPVNYTLLQTVQQSEASPNNADPNCHFRLVSVNFSPRSETVQPGETVTYSTRAEGVYFIRSSVLLTFSDDREDIIYPGVQSGDPFTFDCRNLTLVGSFIVPSDFPAGSVAVITLDYYSTASSAPTPVRSENKYLRAA